MGYTKTKYEFNRLKFDFLLFIINLIFIILPNYFKYEIFPALGLLLYKMLLVNAGFLHAHITRKLAFPSIDFSNTEKGNKYLIIALYTVIIWAYARGG